MLSALYDYAVRNELIMPAGCVRRSIKAYISLDAEGDLIGLEMTDGQETAVCPDIGSLANGADKSNVLAEKLSIVMPEKTNRKSRFFLAALRSAAGKEPRVSACINALTDADTAAQILSECRRNKVKKTDRVSFRVNGVSLMEMPAVMDWWQTFRHSFDRDDNEMARCMITGKLTAAAATLSPIQGLSAVGGHARGDSLICFDKNAFCSYGLRQSANAPVSEEAFAAVKSALDMLLADAPILAGMKFVHWYDRPAAGSDALCDLLDGTDADGSVTRGKTEEPDKYYILLLTGVGGRVMIRRYAHGSYQAMQSNLAQWRSDLEMTDWNGSGPAKLNKLTAMLMRLLKRQKADKDPFRRMNRELSGLTPAILSAIITGGPLPGAVAVRALAYIRSMMTDTNENAKMPPIPDAMCCQWLKAWLLREDRRNNKEEADMVYYNEKHKEPAYHCGAMVAVYGEIQHIAMPDVNVGVIQRCYAAASQTPALVLGQMARLSTFHLSKIASRGIALHYEELLDKVAVAMGDQVPDALDLEQQAYFALGCRQMYAEINRFRHDSRARKLAAGSEV